MDVKEAVRTALTYVNDLYANEGAKNIGLEEVEKDPSTGDWSVTIGLSRPWDFPEQTFANAIQGRSPNRQYKVVRVDQDGNIVAVKIRETKA